MAGTLRIHFTEHDIARTTLAPAPDPLWELVLSASALGTRRLPAPYKQWKDAVVGSLAAPADRAALRTVLTLVPPEADFPDFLTPPTPCRSPEDAVDAIESISATPLGRMRADLLAVFGRRRVPTWLRDLACGSRSTLREVIQALMRYHRTVLCRVQDQMVEAVDADRQLRARQILDDGVVSVLEQLPGTINWSRPTLTAQYPCERDLYLNGRGIRLFPSYFCFDRPVTLIDPELPPVLVYPALGQPQPTTPSITDGLINLLGETRARVLAATRVASTTSELAARTNTSVSTASRHAAVLCGAGLVSSRRTGGAVMHSITYRGRTLLHAPSSASRNED